MVGCFVATLVSSLFPVFSGAFVDSLCLSFIKAFIHPKKKKKNQPTTKPKPKTRISIEQNQLSFKADRF
jgi:hypothetical protein